MIYFPDTNVCIHFLKGTNARIRERFLKLTPDRIAVASIVKAELLLGAAKSRLKEKNRDVVEAFLSPFAIVPFGDDASSVYADFRAQTERRGRPVGPNDLIIAATVHAAGGTLLTGNFREFSHIAGLSVEDWG